jgi:hypothetical protein
MQLPFFGLVIAIFINNDISQNIVSGIIVFCLTMSINCLLVALLNIVLALLNATKDVTMPYKTTMIIKLAMIPFYIINFFTWTIFIIGSLTPFFALFTPILITVSIVTTYFIMLSTGSQNIAYLFRQFSINKNIFYIIYAVCHFIFCLDVIAAILLYCNNNPQLPQQSTPTW